MKKKVFAIFMATMMIVSISACGSSGGSADAEATPEVTEEAEATPEATEEAAEEAAEPTEETTDIEKAIEKTDQAIQDAADATGTDVTTVDEAMDAMSEVAKGGGPATMDKFNQIQTGMTYDEVKEIIGEDGIESVSAESDAASAKVYQWAGETPGSNITVSFLNDEVSSATQVGLE